MSDSHNVKVAVEVASSAVLLLASTHSHRVIYLNYFSFKETLSYLSRVSNWSRVSCVVPSISRSSTLNLVGVSSTWV